MITFPRLRMNDSISLWESQTKTLDECFNCRHGITPQILAQMTADDWESHKEYVLLKHQKQMIHAPMGSGKSFLLAVCLFVFRRPTVIATCDAMLQKQIQETIAVLAHPDCLQLLADLTRANELLVFTTIPNLLHFGAHVDIQTIEAEDVSDTPIASPDGVGAVRGPLAIRLKQKSTLCCNIPEGKAVVYNKQVWTALRIQSDDADKIVPFAIKGGVPWTELHALTQCFPKRLPLLMRRADWLVILDECQHATAEGVTASFQLLEQVSRDPKTVLAFTAFFMRERESQLDYLCGKMHAHVVVPHKLLGDKIKPVYYVPVAVESETVCDFYRNATPTLKRIIAHAISEKTIVLIFNCQNCGQASMTKSSDEFRMYSELQKQCGIYTRSKDGKFWVIDGVGDKTLRFDTVLEINQPDQTGVVWMTKVGVTGIDIPTAKYAVMISNVGGSGSYFIQMCGRISRNRGVKRQFGVFYSFFPTNAELALHKEELERQQLLELARENCDDPGDVMSFRNEDYQANKRSIEMRTVRIYFGPSRLGVYATIRGALLVEIEKGVVRWARGRPKGGTAFVSEVHNIIKKSLDR